MFPVPIIKKCESMENYYDYLSESLLHFAWYYWYVRIRRTSQLSVSALQELVKGQEGELAVGREIANPGTIKEIDVNRDFYF